MKTKKPKKKETLVEQVLNERNLITTTIKEDALKKVPIFQETQLGKIRIEGEVTSEKIALAKNFEKMFVASVDEIMDLAGMIPNEDTVNFIKNVNLSRSTVQDMKVAAPWTTYQIKGETLLKTSDNKIENVKSYFYRLEKAVINQIQLRKEAEEKVRVLEFDLAQTKDDLANTISNFSEYVRSDYKEKYTEKTFLLSLKNFYNKIKETIINLLK